MKKLKTQNLVLAIAALAAVALDQVTKALTVASIPFGKDVPVWQGVFHLTYRQNTGAAFSLLDDSPVFFLVVNSLLVVVLAFLLFSGRITEKISFFSLGAVMTGGFSNLIDRVTRGFVVDMLDVKLFKIPAVTFDPFSVRLADFAVFNVADCFVTCGAVLFIFMYIIKKGEVIAWSSPSAKERSASDSTNSSSDTQG